MAEWDISKTTTTDMKSGVDDYSVGLKTIDEANITENYYEFPYWSQYLGYYKQIPELKQAIDALAMWTVGKGYTTDTRTEVILNNIIGWGEDSFQSIMQNMLIVKKINGDSFSEIIRNEDSGTLLNLKPLNPKNIRIIVNKKGLIERYEEFDLKSKEVKRKFQPYEILHLCNDRVANEIHGTSVVESCKWVIDARNEAMSDWRRILHRNLAGLRIIEVEEEDPTELRNLKAQWADAIEKGEVLILPKGTASPVNINPPTNPEQWIRYLENFFYQAVGVPKIILGGSQEFTEASSKIGYLTFEQVYITEQRLLEQDLLNQLGITLEFIRPVSLKNELQGEETKNTGQTGIQPSEVNTGVQRTE
jgi:hypothetical protein